MLTLLVAPVGNWALQPLETRIAQPPLEGLQIDGIVVLGGMLEPHASKRSGRFVLNNSAERLTDFVMLARQYPRAKLVVSGGSSSVRLDDREADYTRPFLESMGISGERVIYENQSRNTRENAVESLKLAQPGPGEHWLLVTSAFHMPRAYGCFERIGWHVIPYPTDYRIYSNADWMEFDAADQLVKVNLAFKELLGLITYRLSNWTPSLWPGPV